MRCVETTRHKLIVFDAAGTLIRTAKPVAETYFDFGQEFGLTLNRSDIAQRFRIARRGIFSNSQNWRAARCPSSEAIERDKWQRLVEFVFDDLDDTSTLFHQLWNYYAQPDQWALYADVETCIGLLRNRSSEIAIGSNFDGRLTTICQHFDALSEIPVCYSSQVGYRKPDALFYQAIQSKFQIESTQIVMIGNDPVNDYAAPKDFGWNAVLLNRNATDSDESTINTLDQLA